MLSKTAKDIMAELRRPVWSCPLDSQELAKEFAWALAFTSNRISLPCEPCEYDPTVECECGCRKGNARVEVALEKALEFIKEK
jgi:hypothetical protein